jgi:hypothetical protein
MAYDFKPWETTIEQFNLEEREKIIWNKIIDSVPLLWEDELQCPMNRTSKGEWVGIFLSDGNPNPIIMLSTATNFLPKCFDIKID